MKDEIALKHAPPGIDVEDVPGDERAEGSPEDAIVPHPAYAMKQMIVAQQLFKEPRQLLRRDRPHLEQTAEQRIGDLVADFAVRRVESGEQAIEQFDGAFVIRLTQQGIVTSGEIAKTTAISPVAMKSRSPLGGLSARVMSERNGMAAWTNVAPCSSMAARALSTSQM
ncbi:hypothetical protein, partial [Alicyclobacillus acidocaldarius]|uniref:hypothetical protein n=1 Tax=Alicyclobacillus acidocaldarius TaxID=405212 RepID=UPI00345EC041